MSSTKAVHSPLRFPDWARSAQKIVVLPGRALQHRLQQVVDSFPLFDIHRLDHQSIRETVTRLPDARSTGNCRRS